MAQADVRAVCHAARAIENSTALRVWKGVNTVLPWEKV